MLCEVLRGSEDRKKEDGFDEETEAMWKEISAELDEQMKAKGKAQPGKQTAKREAWREAVLATVKSILSLMRVRFFKRSRN